MNKEVEAKELQLKEMTSLINQKEENGSEV